MSVAVASPLQYSHSIGVLGHGGRGFSNPVDVAIRNDGVMFILNRSNPTQGPPGGLRIGIVRVDDQEFLGDFGSHGLDSTSAISDWGYQIQMTGCGDFHGHRGPHDGKETPEGAIPSWSSSPLVPH